MHPGEYRLPNNSNGRNGARGGHVDPHRSLPALDKDEPQAVGTWPPGIGPGSHLADHPESSTVKAIEGNEAQTGKQFDHGQALDQLRRTLSLRPDFAFHSMYLSLLDN